MAKFSKVSFEQFEKDYKAIFGDEITDEQIHEMYDNIKLPKRATAGSAGYDFFAPFTMQIRSYNELLIPTGIRAKLDDGTFLAIVPRSGLGFKHYFRLANEIGIIDADYYNAKNEGHIMVKVRVENHEDDTVTIRTGDGFAQGIILHYDTTEDDNSTAKRYGGMGSTDATKTN